MIKSLFHRSGMYFSGLFLGKIFSTAVFILMAKVLLPERFGVLTLFITLLSVVTTFGDFGMNQWYQKHLESKNRLKFLREILNARVLTLIVTLALFAVFLFWTQTFSLTIAIIFLITLIPEALLSIGDGYYLEKEQSVFVSLKVPSKMAVMLIGYLGFRSSFSLEMATWLTLIGSVLTLLWFFPWAVLKEKVSISFRRIFATLKSSGAYAILIITSFLYARGDSLVIQYTLGSTALGLYGTAYRYLESLSLLPTALAQNLFPVSAKKAGISRRQLELIFFITLAMGVVTAFGTYFFADFLTVGILGPAYHSSTQIVQIFAFVILLFFLNAPLSTVVQSSSFVHRFLPFGIANTFLNIFLNLIFVPRFGVQAAAWVMFTTESTGFLINLYFTALVYKHKQIATLVK